MGKVEIDEAINITTSLKSITIIPEQDDEYLFKAQLQDSAEVTFCKLWNNEDDNFWNEYL